MQNLYGHYSEFGLNTFIKMESDVMMVLQCYCAKMLVFTIFAMRVIMRLP